MLVCGSFIVLASSIYYALSYEFAVSSIGFTAIKLNHLLSSNQDDAPTLRIQGHNNWAEQFTSFGPRWFTQPLDHFSDTGINWKQRYWVSDKHYVKGGPVIVLDGGETSGKNRLAFLDTGIVNILANATGGLGVILEHRYYGASVPVDNFTTDSLRWLDNAQSAADSAHFMKNVVFEGIDEDLTAPNTPWIYYGGSYAGARAAHMRILYPDLVYGAIASSAVTHAQIEFPEYNEIIRKAAPGDCSTHVDNAIKLVDLALANERLNKPIKRLFGLQELTDDVEFVSTISQPLHTWQAKVWDPKVGSTVFDEFCEYLEKDPWRRELVGDLVLDFTILNYAKWIREKVVAKCKKTIPECFSASVSRDWEDNSVNAKWRLWFFQVCTEWGYFISSPRDPDAPRLVSRLITTEYLHSGCAKAFPPGEHMTIPEWPNVSVVNDLGDFEIEADRLAFIDGEVDPWRPATPHSEYASPRNDTLERPFKLIPNAVHHYDEYGLAHLEDEPREILKIHQEMIIFVKHWLKLRQEKNSEV